MHARSLGLYIKEKATKTSTTPSLRTSILRALAGHLLSRYNAVTASPDMPINYRLTASYDLEERPLAKTNTNMNNAKDKCIEFLKFVLKNWVDNWGGSERDYWQSIQSDLNSVETKNGVVSDSFDAKFMEELVHSDFWARPRDYLSGLSGEDWDVWSEIFERIRDGRPWGISKIGAFLNELSVEEWEQGHPHISEQMAHVFEQYLETASKRPAPDGLAASLTDSTPVDFTFSDLARAMRLIGIEDNMRHLKEPEVVQSFLDDAKTVRDGLQDFADDARDLQGGNFAGVLRRKAEKILSEFQTAEELTHLRAERVIMLAQDLEIYSKDQKAADDLGVTIFEILQSRIAQLKRLCRQHFGPSYVSLAPLAQLSLDQIDQEEVVRILDDALHNMNALPSDELYALDAEGMAVLNDMLRELEDYRAAIANASDDEFIAILEARFAESSGALGLSIGRFYERSAAAMGKATRSMDAAIKTNKRVNGLESILEALKDVISGVGS